MAVIFGLTFNDILEDNGTTWESWVPELYETLTDYILGKKIKENRTRQQEITYRRLQNARHKRNFKT